MNKIIVTIITFIAFFIMPLSASQKETDNIAQISAASLYNIDKESLQNTIRGYIKSNPKIKALKIVEELSGKSFIEIYRNENNQLIEQPLPTTIQNSNLFTSEAKFDNEKVGVVFAYFDRTSLNLTKKEKLFLQRNPTIKVVEFFNEPPFTLNNKDGSKSGYMYELLEELAKLSGFQIQYIKNYQTFNAMVDGLAKGDVDVQPTFLANFPLPQNSTIKTTKPILSTPFVVIGRNNSPLYKDLETLNGKKVAVVKGYAQDIHLSNVKGVIKVHVKNNDEGFKALKEGRADYYINNNANTQYILAKSFSNDLKIVGVLPYDTFPPLLFAIGLNGKKPELVSIINKALDNINLNDLKQIKDRWIIDLDHENFNTINLSLTDEEKLWLEKHPIIKFTGDPDWLPFEAFNETNEYIGIVAEHLQLIEDRLGIKIKRVKPKNWDDAVQKALNKEVDAISEVVAQNVVSTTMSYTNPYIQTPLIVVMKQTDKQKFINDLTQIQEKKIAYVSGYGYTEDLKKKYPNIQFLEVQTIKEGLEKTSTGEIDAFVCTLTIGSYNISELGLSNLEIIGKLDIVMKLGFGVRKDWPIFVRILNKALDSITKSETTHIKQNWLGNNLLDKNLTVSIDFSTKEKEFLNKKLPIKYVYDPEWAPFEWKNELGEHTGILYDILSIIEQRSGLILQPTSVDSWDESVNLMKTDQADMYSGIGENSERKQYLQFTKNPIFKSPYVFVSRIDDKHDYLETFKTIKNKKIAVVKGYAIDATLQQEKPDLPLIHVKTVKEGFTKLRNKEIDVFIVNATTANYFINRKGFNDLRVSAKTDYTLTLKIAVQKELPLELISILDKTIETIDDKEFSDIYFKWTELLVKEETNWELIYKILGAGLVILLFITYWNRRLKNAVNQKTDELQKLLASFDENVIASKTDPRGIITYASKEFARISGYSVEELVGQPQNIVRDPAMPNEVFYELWNTIKQGKIWKGEIRNRKKEGGFYWVFAVITPEFNNQNQITGYSAIRQDITAKKVVEELNIKQLEQMQEIERFNKIATGREGRIIELKELINKCYKEMGKETVFSDIDNFESTLEAEEHIINIQQMQLDEIIDIKALQSLLDNFCNSVEIASAIIDLKGNVLAASRWQRACTDFHRVNENSCANCIESDTDLALKLEDGKKFSIYKCKNGLVDCAAPIIIDGQHIANVFIGQFLTQKPDMIYFTDQAKRFNYDEKNYISAIKEVPVIEEEKLPSILGFLSEFAQMVASLSVEKLKATQKEEQNIQSKKAALNLAEDAEEARKEVLKYQEHLESLVEERTKELDNERTYINAIMNSQTNIVISSDGVCLRTANKAFLDFYSVENTDEFIEKFGDCICDTFDTSEPEIFIQKMMGEEKWLDYVYARPKQIHKAKIIRNNKAYIFTITADKFTFDDQELKTAVFTDITRLEKIQKEIEAIHKHTRDSIEYASLIQHAIVPSNNLFEKYFNNYLAIWEPKDIVGGDIYLFEELRHDDECMLMVIDCTGHGVPGAFVTMLVKAIERQVSAIIATKPNMDVSPAWVLGYFNKTMKSLLQQEDEESISNAGFDGGVLYYNKKENIIKFAGAETPLFYFTAENELKIIKGDRHSIGYKKSDSNYAFKEHIIELQTGMKFYLTTDGYLDQNGGEKGFPFGKKRFKEIIEENHKEPMSVQQDILMDKLKLYQAKEERNDDITVIGVEII